MQFVANLTLFPILIVPTFAIPIARKVQTIKEAAPTLDQTVSEFAISTVIREARQVLQDAQITRLSNRDRDRFLSPLDDTDTKPNATLKAAARRYGKLSGAIESAIRRVINLRVKSNATYWLRDNAEDVIRLRT